MEAKMDIDEALVLLVQTESIIWKRNHLHFKNVQMKEQAWGRVSYNLGISVSEAERRFKSIREKYRRRKILLERDQLNNVVHSKLKSWDLYYKLGFLDDHMIPRNSGSESLGMILCKSDSSSNENISSTNNTDLQQHSALLKAAISVLPRNNIRKSQASMGLLLRPVGQMTSNQIQEVHSNTGGFSTPPNDLNSLHTTVHDIYDDGGDLDPDIDPESDIFSPSVKMEVPDDDDDDEVQVNHNSSTNDAVNDHNYVEQRNSEDDDFSDKKQNDLGNFNYVGDFISQELNKLPLRHAFELKNILVRQVLAYSEKALLQPGD